MEEPLVACSVLASSLLSPRFIRELGVQELLSCCGLLLPFLPQLALPPHLCTLGEVMGRESLRGVFSCFRLPHPPYLCMLGEVVRWVRLPSAAPVRVPPWPPDLRLGRPGGYLSLFLVRWLLCAVLLLTLSLRLPCSVWQSRRCGCGSSCWLFSLVRSLAVYGPLAVSQRALLWFRCGRWRFSDR